LGVADLSSATPADGAGRDARRLGVNPLRVTGMERATPAVKSPGVVFRGCRVIFWSCQALSAGMSLVGTSLVVLAVWSGTAVTRALARTSKPR
jgi:hypothetical protein